VQFPSIPGNPGVYCSGRCRGQVIGGSNRATRPDLFTSWTPEECWLAGLLWADGHYNESRPGKPRIMLNLTDEDAMKHAVAITGGRYGTHSQPTFDGYNRKPVHRMSFGERHAVRRLVAIGFMEPKLTTRSWPDLPHLASFLRGAFDGDGSVLLHQQGGRKKTAGSPLRLHSALCGSVPFLEGVQAFLVPYGIAPKKILGGNAMKSVWKVQWNHRDSLRLAAMMYAEPGPFIARKREIFDRA
jgi:hypothetical protein